MYRAIFYNIKNWLLVISSQCFKHNVYNYLSMKVSTVYYLCVEPSFVLLMGTTQTEVTQLKLGKLKVARQRLLQRYEHQTFVSCLAGLYGCQWRRYQRTHAQHGHLCSKVLYNTHSSKIKLFNLNIHCYSKMRYTLIQKEYFTFKSTPLWGFVSLYARIWLVIFRSGWKWIDSKPDIYELYNGLKGLVCF